MESRGLGITGKTIMKDCLEMRGYNPTDEQIDELTEIYEECQEWTQSGVMVSGNSYDEIEDFVKHSRCIDEVINNDFEGGNGIYYWRAYSDDDCFDDESDIGFKTEKEAYDDMRNHVFEKMKWNTEYDEDFDETEMILYEVEFSQDKIIHRSYSGVYTYEIFKKG